jgi:hypothetical protein
MLRKLRKRLRCGRLLSAADRDQLCGAKIKMSGKYFVRLPVVPFEILGVALFTGQTTSVIAEESYPWCASQNKTANTYVIEIAL